MRKERKLLFISTGGTIAQMLKVTTLTSVATGNNIGKEVAFVLETAKDYLDISKIDTIALMDKDSSNIVPNDWVLIIDTIIDNYDNYDFFLITHGTNTLGYTCAALSFAFENLGKPIVLTGSQVPIGYPGSDAILNLENAIRVVADDQFILAGVMAVFGSQIITGTRVKKISGFNYDAFKAFNSTPPIGRVGRHVEIDRNALQNHLSWLEPRARNKSELKVNKNFDLNIVSLNEFPGLNPEIFKILIEESRKKGIILRSTGSGDPNILSEDCSNEYANLRDSFKYLQAMKIPIVITTQAPEGIASMDVNMPGLMAAELGAIPAWDMSIEALTVKLAWLIGRNISYDEIRRQMVMSFKGEINMLRG